MAVSTPTKLTEKQQQVLDYIQERQPIARDYDKWAQELGFDSRKACSLVVGALKRMGYIDKSEKKGVAHYHVTQTPAESGSDAVADSNTSDCKKMPVKFLNEAVPETACDVKVFHRKGIEAESRLAIDPDANRKAMAVFSSLQTLERDLKNKGLRLPTVADYELKVQMLERLAQLLDPSIADQLTDIRAVLGALQSLNQKVSC